MGKRKRVGESVQLYINLFLLSFSSKFVALEIMGSEKKNQHAITYANVGKICGSGKHLFDPYTTSLQRAALSHCWVPHAWTRRLFLDDSEGQTERKLSRTNQDGGAHLPARTRQRCIYTWSNSH